MAINDLQDYKLDDLYEDMELTDEEFENKLATMGLLHESMTCQCGSLMKLVSGHHIRKEWRCDRRIHRQQAGPATLRRGFKVGIFFEGANLSCNNIFKLSYFWAQKQTVEYAEFETGISHRQVVHWYKKFRKVCSQYFRVNPVSQFF
uniref:Uncharacterized protein n=1 Tax=Acrobeloides nanus TaxID=290746 RepID=A0A914CF62_9BILA